MSSRSSPAIAIDCRLPAVLGPVPWVATLMAALVPWLVPASPLTLVSSVLCAGIVFAGFRSAGWLGGPHALESAFWSAEGDWWLKTLAGSTLPARLLPDSRVFAGWLWLRWETPAGRRQAFLARDSRDADAVRRLATRLRLQAAPPDWQV
jgi:hypothetical protein